MAATLLPTLSPDEIELPQPWRWTREDFHRAVELGLFSEDDRIELIDGEIYSMSPQSRLHYNTIQRAAKRIARLFGDAFSVETQGPAAIAFNCEPEPDIKVVRGDSEDYEDHPGPQDIVLVVEVSDSSPAKDRILKGESYARGGVVEYWVLNLRNRTLEVRRDPGPHPDDPTRFVYSNLKVMTPDESVEPLLAPGTTVRVADLLPKLR